MVGRPDRQQPHGLAVNGAHGGGQRRSPNPRLVKIHRSYSVDEAASLLDVHKNTVREWLRRGLPALAERRPILIMGRDLVDFLTARRRANKQPCRPGELYCMRCRQPRFPLAREAQYLPLTETAGNLVGICSTCGTRMFRRIGAAGLIRESAILTVHLPLALEHIGERSAPSVNYDFKQE